MTLKVEHDVVEAATRGQCETWWSQRVWLQLQSEAPPVCGRWDQKLGWFWGQVPTAACVSIISVCVILINYVMDSDQLWELSAFMFNYSASISTCWGSPCLSRTVVWSRHRWWLTRVQHGYMMFRAHRWPLRLRDGGRSKQWYHWLPIKSHLAPVCGFYRKVLT